MSRNGSGRPRRIRLSPRDQLRTALIGPLSRKTRTALSALGIAVGMAALTAITGIAATNQAQLLAELDDLGANLLVVAPGLGPDRTPVALPESAPGMIARIPSVDRVGVVRSLPDGTNVYRTDLVAAGETNGLTAMAAGPEFLDSIEGALAQGEWFDESTRGLPTAVLGSAAAARLGISEVDVRVWIGGQWYVVIGILESAGLADQVNTAAFIGDEWAEAHVMDPEDVDESISTIYVRSSPGKVGAVRDVLAQAANPYSPYVQVSKLSDLEDARKSTDASLSGLAIGLAAIALLVGGIGIANTMVIAVLERRGEIGLRRALGARAGQIAAQFVGEAIMLALLGAVVGVIAGILAVFAYAGMRGQPAVVPPEAIIGGPLVAVVVGVIAGLYPALSAARLSPTVALRAV